MANNNQPTDAPETPAQRAAALTERVKVCLTTPGADKVAPVIAAVRVGVAGGYTGALVRLYKAGTPLDAILDGYVAARLVKYAAKQAHKSKDSASVAADCRKHGQNHIKLMWTALAIEAADATKVA